MKNLEIKKRSRRVYCIIMNVATEEIRIVPLVAGYRPKADPEYRVHGPFPSRQAAERCISEKSSTLRRVLYENGKQFVSE